MTKAQKEITKRDLETIAQKWNKEYEGTSMKFYVSNFTIRFDATMTNKGIERPMVGHILSVDVSKKCSYSSETLTQMTKERAVKELKKMERDFRNINFRSGWILK